MNRGGTPHGASFACVVIISVSAAVVIILLYLLSHLFYRTQMSYNRFCLINRFLHLSDSSMQPARGDINFDPWYKVRPVLDHLNRMFKRYFTPYKMISIDESMIGMKNRHVYIQYMPNKRHCRFGIKKFELCDSSTSYVYHVVLYSGRDFDVGDGEQGQGFSVVQHLLQQSDLLNKGYHLVTDNFYTRVALAQYLLEQRTLLTGTVRLNSVGFPKDFETHNVPIQTAQYKSSGEMLACAYQDKATQKKPVMLLSTGSTPTNFCYEKREKQKMKPAMVVLYNKSMGGVDMSDRKIYQIAAERATKRYWVKIFRNLIDMSIRNSYELFLKAHPRSKLTCVDFCTDIVESLCGSTDPIPAPPPIDPNHQLADLPGSTERECVVCSDRQAGRRRRSRTWCPGCRVGVHKKCWEQFRHIVE